MKRNIIFMGAALFLSAGVVFADMTYSVTQPTFGTGLGVYSSRNVGTGIGSARAVEETAKEWNAQDKELGISNKTVSTSRIKKSRTGERFIPASSGYGYSYESGTDGFVYGYAEGGEQGVNETKTIYTDGIGRLHFFGKGNVVRN